MHIILLHYCFIKQNCVCRLPDRSINTLLFYKTSQSTLAREILLHSYFQCKAQGHLHMAQLGAESDPHSHFI